MTRVASEQHVPLRIELAANWRALLITAIALGTGASLLGPMFSIFMKPLQAEFGWSRTQISASLFMVVLATFSYPLIGRLIDRFGVRRVVPVSALGLALGFMITSRSTQALWTFYLGVFVAMAAGGATTALSYSRIIGDTFVHHRGFALGLMLSGASLVPIAVAPLVGWVVGEQGWRAGFFMLAAIAVMVAGPMGWTAGRFGQGGGAPAVSAADPVAGCEWRDALRMRSFWVLCASIFLTGVPVIGIAAHIQPLFEDRGLVAERASWMISVLAVGVVTGRFASGLLIDRYWAPGVASVILTFAAIGAGMLSISDTNILLGITSVLLLGLAQGAELDLGAFLVMRYFGMRAYSVLYGIVMIVFAAALPLGAILFGQLFDRYGDYRTALLIGVAFLLTAAALFPVMGRYPGDEG